jgi:hypothetical protein
MHCPTHGGQRADNHADLNQSYALAGGIRWASGSWIRGSCS